VSIAALFLLLAAGVTGWWLVARQLTEKPWERREDPADEGLGGGAVSLVSARLGLWFFLAVITSFFTLFISAYSMRMDYPDWTPFAKPGLLWLNTFMLVLSSIAFQWSRGAALAGDAPRVKAGLIGAGFFAFAFLAGQLLAWQKLNASGYFVANNPANAFFYLLTGLHGLHLLGGLSVWGRTTARMWRGGSEPGDIRISVELCAVYWHYLLLVWLVLFALLLST
jgi:cytochrome c oxidase subunit III